MKQRRTFKGIWIPAAIWLNTDLNAIEKILFAEVHSFTSNSSSCYKSNETLSDELNVSSSTIKRAIKKLEHAGLIVVHRSSRTRVMEALGLDCMVQHDLLEGQNELPTDQNDPQSGSNCTPSNIVSSTPTIPISIVMPFDSDKFALAWTTWLTERSERKYKKYTNRGEQGALHKLMSDANGDEDVAIEMIGNSIVNGWRGIFPLKENKSKHGKSVTNSFDSDKLQSYIESLGDN